MWAVVIACYFLDGLTHFDKIWEGGVGTGHGGCSLALPGE